MSGRAHQGRFQLLGLACLLIENNHTYNSERKCRLNISSALVVVETVVTRGRARKRM
jgi:hypothetical protein